MDSKLAIFGGEKAVQAVPDEMFAWPVITKEDEEAVMDVLHTRRMSGTDITRKFEEEFAKWQGSEYGLGFNNGTAAIQAAFFGCGIGAGDEVICPAVTYWASCTSLYSLRATPVFADIDPQTLCIDPEDIERCITDRTKAIIVVHYLAHPAAMDEIMEIAKRHNLKVIEDVSHAQGGLYHGRRLGTIGDVGAMSLMTGKSFACGEMGILTTDDLEIYERAIAFSHYERNGNLHTASLKPFEQLALGGVKGRVHQMSSAMGLVQLKYYDERCREIRRAINYFWDKLEGVPGIRPHRVKEDAENNMAGWYYPHGLYRSEELGGLSITRFCEAVRAEGAGCDPGANNMLPSHGLFQAADIYHEGKPIRISMSSYDVRKLDEGLEVSKSIGKMIFSIPWFKKFQPEIIDQYVNAFRKAAENYQELLRDDPGNPDNLGVWFTFKG